MFGLFLLFCGGLFFGMVGLFLSIWFTFDCVWDSCYMPVCDLWWMFVVVVVVVFVFGFCF
jgi:hypothetical protein